MSTLHLLVLSHLSLAWCCLKKSKDCPKLLAQPRDTVRVWVAQGSSFPAWAPWIPPCPQVLTAEDVTQWTWTWDFVFPHGNVGPGTTLQFQDGKESKESGRLLKSGGLKHCITSLHKYKQKKVCVMFQEYLLGLIWSMSVEKNLFCPCILPLTTAFFKQLLQKASGVCRYFRQSKI